jgi:glycosyltransferase involved in cell wall biosynthesis
MKTIIVMPAYNAAKTLERTIKEIPENSFDEIIVVDDASSDGTFELAKKLNVTVIKHEKNSGYGANQKTCYQEALKRRADIIIMLHADYQYDPQLIPLLKRAMIENKADCALASRMLGNPLKGGMPLYKFIGNKALTAFENFILQTNFSEFHTGYRAFTKDALLAVNFQKNSNGFLFDNEIIIQFVKLKMKIIEIPTTTRYAYDSSSVNFLESIKYGFGILFILVKFLFKQ